MPPRRYKAGVTPMRTESPNKINRVGFSSVSDVNQENIDDIKPRKFASLEAKTAIPTIPTKVRNDGPISVETARKVEEEPADYTEDMKEEFCGLQIAPPKTNKQIALSSKEVDKVAHDRNENVSSSKPLLPSSATKLVDVTPSRDAHTDGVDSDNIDSNQNNLDCEDASELPTAHEGNECSRKLRDRINTQSYFSSGSEPPDMEHERSFADAIPCDNDGNNVSGAPDIVFSSPSTVAAEIANVAPTANDIDMAMDLSKSLDSPSNESEKFKCFFCSKCYSKYSHFWHHQRSHKSGRPFACSLCSKRFPEKGALLKHRPSHTGGMPFKCDVCDKRFVLPKYLANHMKYHTEEKQIACSICDKRFTRKVDLQKHKLKHTANKPYACGICRRPFGTIDAMINHRMKEHPTTSQVQNVNMSAANGSTSVNSNNREGSTEHELNGFNETNADETYPNALESLISAVNLLNSSPTLKDKVNKKVELSQTDKESGDIVGWEPEKAVANGDESIDSSQNSPDCESTVNARIATEVNEYTRKLRDRSSLIEKKPDVQSYLEQDSESESSDDSSGSSEEDCSDSEYEDITDDPTARDIEDSNTSGAADSVLPSSSTKAAETAISSPASIDLKKANEASRCMEIPPLKAAKRFKCDICEKTFNRKKYLQSHKITHTGEKPFSCSICEERFGRKIDLNRHQKLHTGGKTFSCPICATSYNRKDSLLGHLRRRHSGQRVFACSSCDERFINTSERKMHEHTHSDKKPYQCSTCKQGYTRNYALERHKLERHTLIHTDSLTNGSASNDFKNLVHPTKKESKASSGTIATIWTADDLAPHRSSNTAAHSSSIKKEVKKELKRKTISREESSDKVQLEPTQKKSRKTDAKLEPTLTELVDNEDDIPVDQDSYEYVEDSYSFKSDQDARSSSNEFADTSEYSEDSSEYMEDSFSFNSDQNPESSSKEPEEDGLTEHNRNTHTVSELTDSRTGDIDKKNADLEPKPSLVKVTIETGSENIKEASVECNAVTSMDVDFSSVSKGVHSDDDVPATPIGLELPLPTNTFNSEPEPINGQIIRYKKGSIGEEIERMATAHADNLYLVWSEEFSLDLALAVARNKSNCVLIVKNFSSTSLVETFNMDETYQTSVIKFGPNADSLRIFSFGRMILPRKILDKGRFKSISDLESMMTKFFYVQEMQLVNVLQFTQGADGWFETLKCDLKEDLIITNT